MSETLGGVEQRSIGYSVILHAGLILIAAVGLPILLPKNPEPEPLVMTVDIVPIGAMTNIKPSDQPIQKQQEAQASKNSKPVPPTVQQQPPKPAEEQPHFNPMEEAVPDDTKKPKPEEKPKEEAKEQTDFAKLMSKLNQESKANTDTKAKDKTNAEENKTRSSAPYDDSLPLSISEKDAIRNQFMKCWRMPAGAKDPASLIVKVHVLLKEDGGLISAELAEGQESRYGSDSFFRAAADGALRAVHQCTEAPMGPLKDLPPDKYGSWRDMVLTFDPSQLLY